MSNRVSVSGIDAKGLTVTIESDKVVKSGDETVKEAARLLKDAFYMGLKDKADPEFRGLERQFVTHFVLRKKSGAYEVDLFTQYLDMKVVTLYVGDNGVEEKFLEKSQINDLSKFKTFPANAFNRSSGEAEYLHELPKPFFVTIKPNGMYKDGQAKGKQKVKAVL